MRYPQMNANRSSTQHDVADDYGDHEITDRRVLGADADFSRCRVVGANPTQGELWQSGPSCALNKEKGDEVMSTKYPLFFPNETDTQTLPAREKRHQRFAAVVLLLKPFGADGHAVGRK